MPEKKLNIFYLTKAENRNKVNAINAVTDILKMSIHENKPSLMIIVTEGKDNFCMSVDGYDKQQVKAILSEMILALDSQDNIHKLN